MTTFVNAVINQEARTTNGMKARANTGDACTDLFFKIGASRGKNVIPDFVAAYVTNPNVALRIALWARDVREGAGERKIFRDILTYLANNVSFDETSKVIDRTVDLGRWDDILILLEDTSLEQYHSVVLNKINQALRNGDGLCAKWMPRKGDVAVKLRNYMGMTPKQYRKTLVNLTKVVETQMCAKDWDNINFSHVPSLAASRYKKAFNRHTTSYKTWVESLIKGDKSVKVNAGAVYPYDVIKGLANYSWRQEYTKTELDAIVAQWNALPNYVGDANILPLVDVSGSMGCLAGGNKNLTCLDVAVSLGLYCADKNTGKFKDTFLTFSDNPSLVNLKGDIVQKVAQMSKSDWAMNTNLHKAFDKILSVAVKGNVPQEEMPEVLLIMSDMQFDVCVKHDDSAIEMISRKYENAGYKIPNVVFWNLNSTSNVPVKFDARGVALVSGFSPTILKSVLAGNFDDMTPYGIMMNTVMKDRYAI